MKETTEISIQLMPNAKAPFKEFESSIGIDCFAYIKDENGNPASMTIHSGRGIIPLGFKIELPPNFGAFMMNRSGMAANGLKGYENSDGTIQKRYVKGRIDLGLIDPNYRGMCGAIYYNSGYPFIIKDGDAIGQLVINEFPHVKLVEKDKLTDPHERGEQGFNS